MVKRAKLLFALLLCCSFAIAACSGGDDPLDPAAPEPVLPTRPARPDLATLRAASGGAFQLLEAAVLPQPASGWIRVAVRVENASDTPRMTPVYFVVLDAGGAAARAIEAPAVRLLAGERRVLYAHVPVPDAAGEYGLLIASDDDALESGFTWGTTEARQD